MAYPEKVKKETRRILNEARAACRALGSKDIRMSEMIKKVEAAVAHLETLPLSPKMRERLEVLRGELEIARKGEVNVGRLLERLGGLSI